MKKNRKIFQKFLTILSITTLSFVFLVSCNKDDDDDNAKQVAESSLKPLLGTYKGKIKVFPLAGGVNEYFDAEVTLTDAGDNKVRITPKAGQPYSSATPKEIKITILGNSIGTWYGLDAQGTITYDQKANHLMLITEENAATDIKFIFEGPKQ